MLARKADTRCNLVEISLKGPLRDAVLDAGVHFHGEGPTDIAQQSRTALVVSVLGIASFAILCGAWKDSGSFKARPRCLHADGGIQRCVGIDAFENISNALVVVAIGELHRSVFFAPFASIDPVICSLSDGEAAFSWAWAWLHTISWTSPNKFWDQFICF